jgi:CTP:molybdopterin cytidylyltransferase MocA
VVTPSPRGTVRSFADTGLLVLAAGASTRFQGRPKAMLDVDGEPAVRRVLRVARSLGVEDAVVVVGPHRAEIGAVVRDDEARVVVNSEWELGRTGSVQAGLRALGSEGKVLLWPIDHPFAHVNTVHALLATAARDPIAAWIMPTFEGRGGHPIWLSPAATRLVLALEKDTPLRSLIPRLGVQVVRVPVEDRWIRIGTDTPDEYAHALALRTGQE